MLFPLNSVCYKLYHVSLVILTCICFMQESSNIVFHIVTDRQNFFALKLWCARNSFKKASVHIINIEDLDLEQPIELDSEEFRVSIHASDQPSSLQMKTEYMSVFSPAHFLLPRIFKNLKRVVVLDDDVVVQRDLSPLWKLDMEGKVNGAVQFCRVRLGHLKSYLTNQNYESSTCAWVSGLNVVNLEKWRELDVTGTYQQLLKKVLLQLKNLPELVYNLQNLSELSKIYTKTGCFIGEISML